MQWGAGAGWRGMDYRPRRSRGLAAGGGEARLLGVLGGASGGFSGGDALLGESVSGLLVGDLRHGDHRARAVRAIART